ncbi:MAG: glycosyltransferase [Spirulina sp.]
MKIDPKAVRSTAPHPAVDPFVSVIIPVYNDARRLKTCLAALEEQTYPSHRYEIIVIDNGSEPEEDVTDLAHGFDHVILTQEQIPGSYAARNKGLTLAKGNIIAFTDSDCVPKPDWLEQGVSYLVNHPDCGLVAGRIDMFVEQPEKVTAIEMYDQVVMGFPQESLIITYKTAMTANIFTRRSVIEDIGNFRSDLRSTGDGEWAQRVYKAGYEHRYAAQACVGHPARDTFKALTTRVTRYTGGKVDRFITHEPVWWKRYRRFVRFIVEDLTIHAFTQSRKVLQDDRINTIGMRIKVLGLVVVMQLLSVSEIVRIKLGGQSRR